MKFYLDELNNTTTLHHSEAKLKSLEQYLDKTILANNPMHMFDVPLDTMGKLVDHSELFSLIFRRDDLLEHIEFQ